MIYIFLPAFNEEIALPRLVHKIDQVFKNFSQPFQIIVLNDGSSDGTLLAANELKKKYPVTILDHPQNLGLGMTMKDGFRYLESVISDKDVVVTLDCDDTHEPEFLPAAIKKLDEGFDLVILSRYCEGGGQEGLSKLKSFLSGGAGFFLKLFFPIPNVREYSCNFRVFRGSIIKKAYKKFGENFMQLTHLGFVVAPEILIKLRMLGARISESPFTLRYQQKPTPSKNNTIRTISGYFALVALCWGKKID